MSINSKNVSRNAGFARESIQLALGTSATSQTAKLVDSVTIPYPFQVLSVEAWALTVTSTMTFDVQIGTTSVLSAQVTPVAATKTAATLSTTVANTQNTTSTGALSLLYTSGGSGAATNAFVTVWIRPLGMQGDSFESYTENA